MANFPTTTVKVNALFFCKEITRVACMELYDKELNHLYSKEYRTKALALCSDATAKAVRKKYDMHCHDHYVVDDTVVDNIAKRLIKAVQFKDGKLSIGGLSVNAYD